jgi:hypothetical protein
VRPDLIILLPPVLGQQLIYYRLPIKVLYSEADCIDV